MFKSIKIARNFPNANDSDPNRCKPVPNFLYQFYNSDVAFLKVFIFSWKKHNIIMICNIGINKGEKRFVVDFIF